MFRDDDTDLGVGAPEPTTDILLYRIYIRLVQQRRDSAKPPPQVGSRAD